MPIPRREISSGKSFGMPLLGIVLLLASYWVLSDWHQLPVLFSETLTNFQWLY